MNKKEKNPITELLYPSVLPILIIQIMVWLIMYFTILKYRNLEHKECSNEEINRIYDDFSFSHISNGM